MKIVDICRLFFLLSLLMSCKDRGQEAIRFTQGQIDSLCLDSTKLVQADVLGTTRIDLNRFLKKQAFDFGAYVRDVRLVPLETTNESLIGSIYNILITDSMIYVVDNYKKGGIVIFDREGKFIKRIPSGRGPGELYRLYDIAYDKENNELLAYQHPFLLFYNKKGDYIRQIRLPFGFYDFLVTPRGYVFKTLDKYGNEHLGDKMYSTLLVTDKNFKLNSAGLANLGEATSIGFNYLYTNDGNIWITQNYNDTIYQYISATNELKAGYIMDYDSKKLPDHYLKTTKQDIQNILGQNDYYYYIGEYLETSFHQAFFLRNDYIGLQMVVYRDKRSNNMIGGTNADYNINEIPAIAFPRTTWGPDFISVHYPNPNDSLLLSSSVISDVDKQKLKEKKEDDNPMLVFFRLRDI